MDERSHAPFAKTIVSAAPRPRCSLSDYTTLGMAIYLKVGEEGGKCKDNSYFSSTATLL